MRKLLIIGATLVTIAVAAVVALVVITLLRDDDPDLATSAPEIPTAAPAGSTPAPNAPAGSGSTAASGTVLHFVIEQTGSEAKYVVREKLSRLPVESDAVGTTNQITGDLYLTNAGLATDQRSSFRVDLNAVRTDEGLRDSWVRSSVLQTNRGENYRYATFVAESITGFPAGYVDGQEAAMKLRGQLTIHNVTRPVEWDVKARRSGDTLTGIADLRFNMSEYGITPPNVSTARSFDGVILQITIVAKRAAT